jgi:hypothetical protein
MRRRGSRRGDALKTVRLYLVGRRCPIALVALLLILVIGSGCGAGTSCSTQPDDEGLQPIETARSTTTESSSVTASKPAESSNPTDGLRFVNSVVLTFAGEHPAFHPPILSTTIHFADDGTARGAASEDFSEPAGIQTFAGVDTFSFEGTWDEKTGELAGELKADSLGVQSGADSEDSTIHYVLSGQLRAKLVPGTDRLEGTLTGNSRLTQVREGDVDGSMDVDDQYPISWTVKGTLSGQG